MNSALYEGWVRHRRFSPRPHNFKYRVFMAYLDLDELPGLFDGAAGWSAQRPALAWFKRSDYLGDPDTPLRDAVCDRVEEETGQRPSGPIRLLTNLRYFGYIMNPISCYYCFAADGETLEYLVADVTNTPWDERHSYVLDARGGDKWLRCSFDKRFHVSPFHPMDMRYHWHSNNPARKLVLHMSNEQDGETVFDASLSMSRQPATAKNLQRKLLSYPLMTAKVGLAIYWQALRLWFKGIPFHTNPKTAKTSIAHE